MTVESTSMPNFPRTGSNLLCCTHFVEIDNSPGDITEEESKDNDNEDPDNSLVPSLPGAGIEAS